MNAAREPCARMWHDRGSGRWTRRASARQSSPSQTGTADVEREEHGEEFAREFINTTFLWTPYWLNERELAHRPWLHEPNYVKIDKLLREEIPEYFVQRKNESEYSCLFLAKRVRDWPSYTEVVRRLSKVSVDNITID